MPKVNLIFFEDPRELTDEQVTEARLAGLLREDEPHEDAPEAPPAPSAEVTPRQCQRSSPRRRRPPCPPQAAQPHPCHLIPGTTDPRNLPPVAPGKTRPPPHGDGLFLMP